MHALRDREEEYSIALNRYHPLKTFHPTEKKNKTHLHQVERHGRTHFARRRTVAI